PFVELGVDDLLRRLVVQAAHHLADRVDLRRERDAFLEFLHPSPSGVAEGGADVVQRLRAQLVEAELLREPDRLASSTQPLVGAPGQLPAPRTPRQSRRANPRPLGPGQSAPLFEMPMRAAPLPLAPRALRQEELRLCRTLRVPSCDETIARRLELRASFLEV